MNVLAKRSCFFICLPLVCLMMYTGKVRAQDGRNMIGLRGQQGFTTVTYKRILDERSGVEVLVHPFNKSLVLEPVYELYFPLGDNGLNWFMGPGVSLKFAQDQLIMGILGMVGIDYSFGNIPLNLSLDWKPSFEVINGSNTYMNGVGLGIRFVF